VTADGIRKHPTLSLSLSPTKKLPPSLSPGTNMEDAAVATKERDHRQKSSIKKQGSGSRSGRVVSKRNPFFPLWLVATVLTIDGVSEAEGNPMDIPITDYRICGACVCRSTVVT